MSFRSHNSVKHTMATAVIACGVFLFLDSCGGGGCSRRDDVTKLPPAVTIDNTDEADILESPISFDEQSVAETARMLRADITPSPSETAQAILVSEAAVRNLDDIVTPLYQNDDNADIWHVLTELSDHEWPSQLLDIVNALEALQLDGIQSQRLYRLRETLARDISIIDNLCAGNSRFPSPFKNNR